ncbi:response regulator (plasmid) [Priestia sp. MF3]|uniref:response regulator n=1 Tax=Priestia sp. MF3 TaxID=3404779 RepID=UPI003B9E6D60
MKYRVAIIVNHVLESFQLESILNKSESYILIGKAGSIGEFYALAKHMKTDVILVDFNIPEPLQAIRRLHRRYPVTTIIILVDNEDKLVEKGLLVGAQGYLLKRTMSEDLFRTLDSAVRRETPNT